LGYGGGYRGARPPNPTNLNERMAELVATSRTQRGSVCLYSTSRGRPNCSGAMNERTAASSTLLISYHLHLHQPSRSLGLT